MNDDNLAYLEDAARAWLLDLCHVIELDPNNPNLWDTPRRIAKAYDELLVGHSHESQDELLNMSKVVFPTTHQELVAVTGIKIAGICPHHFLPVLYTIDVGYVPRDHAIGISKIPRIIKLLAARAVLQEDLTSDIAEFLMMSLLQPRGVAVVVVGFHTCMSVRGTQAREAMTSTAAMRGVFLENDADVKGEFMSLRNGDSLWA